MIAASVERESMDKLLDSSEAFGVPVDFSLTTAMVLERRG